MTMKLFPEALEAMSQDPSLAVSDSELRTLKKKVRFGRTRAAIVLFTVILLIAGVWSVFEDTAALPMICLGLVLFIPLTVWALRKKPIHSCRARVTAKETRYAPKQPRSSPPIVPYNDSKSPEETAGERDRYYEVYYCSVEIGGQVFENVCCRPGDYEKIAAGGGAIVSDITAGSEAVVFAAR